MITAIDAYMVLDSRGYPTVCAEVIIDNQFKGKAYVPSGASTGQYEALELRDGDNSYYCGKGINKVLAIIKNKLTPLLMHQSFDTQAQFDDKLKQIDGTKTLHSLGANTVLSLSLAFARAMANKHQVELYQSINHDHKQILPIPMLNVVNGGAHANNTLDIQEFMIVPHGFEYFSEAMRAGCEVYHHLRQYLQAHNYSTAVGDEGGFAPNIDSAENVLDMLSEIITKSGYTLGREISFALDIAASEFYQSGSYHYANKTLSSHALVDQWLTLAQAFPILSIEDPLADDDIEGWQLMTKQVNDQCLVVGDDLLVTSYERLKQGIDDHWMNSILIKLNQVGTLTDTMRAIQLAKHNQKSYIISHRSGETEDDFIADLAIATNAPFIKTGAPCRSERLAKYNRLLAIEHLNGAKLYKLINVKNLYGQIT